MFVAVSNLMETRNGRKGDHPAWFKREVFLKFPFIKWIQTKDILKFAVDPLLVPQNISFISAPVLLIPTVPFRSLRGQLISKI